MNNCLNYILVLFLVGCGESPIEPEVSPESSCSGLRINGTNESFCGELVDGVSSELLTLDSLYIYNENDTFFRSSENYKAYLLGFANYIPDSSRFDFFKNLIDLFSPESYHDLDINKPGGFAIEVWDYSGEYYSSELGPQTKGGQIFIRNTTTYMAGPVYNQVRPHMSLSFENRNPIILWNSDNTKSLEVEVNKVDYFILYPF